MTTQCLYVSRCAAALTHNEVQRLLGTSRMLNRRVDITGVLVHTGNYFAQIVEGAPHLVDLLLKKIAKDRRHADPTVVLLEHGRSQRMFGDWSMELIELPSFDQQVRSLHEARTALGELSAGAGAELRDRIAELAHEVRGSSMRVESSSFRLKVSSS